MSEAQLAILTPRGFSTPLFLAESGPLVEDPAGLLAVLLAALALIFRLGQTRAGARVFRVVPMLVFCYFVPTALTTLGIIPSESALYAWVKKFVLPASLLLMILALDLPGIIRLGPKALIMFLAGTLGVVLGGPLAIYICQPWLPPDAWQGMAALSGSWIGGGANFVAIGQSAGASSEMIALMVIPDVFVASIWMGTLLYLSGHQLAIDRRMGANAQAIRDLEQRMTEFQERVNRIPNLPDLILIVALGFGGSWVAFALSRWLHASLAAMGEGGVTWMAAFQEAVPEITWKFIIVTTIGVVLSFTRVRNLEGAGASKVGSVMLYLLIACIGASADFRKIVEAPALIAAGGIWMAVHITVLLTVAKLIRAPIFFVAVGSQANIGGAASAPVVASAFHRSLAPVGVLLAVAGYVMGTYAGLLCMRLLRWAAEARGV